MVVLQWAMAIASDKRRRGNSRLVTGFRWRWWVVSFFSAERRLVFHVWRRCVLEGAGCLFRSASQHEEGGSKPRG